MPMYGCQNLCKLKLHNILEYMYIRTVAVKKGKVTQHSYSSRQKKLPFPLRATPFRFCSVGFPFTFTFLVALNCVPLRTAKVGQTFNLSSLKFLMLQLNNLGIPCVQW